MKMSERLIERLRSEGQALPPCAELRRTNRNHRTGTGVWSWFAYCPLAGRDPDHARHMDLHVGSHWPMSELLAAPKLSFQRLGCGDICVDPYDVSERGRRAAALARKVTAAERQIRPGSGVLRGDSLVMPAWFQCVLCQLAVLEGVAVSTMTGTDEVVLHEDCCAEIRQLAVPEVT